MPGSTPTLRDMVQDALDRGQTLDQLEERAVDPVTGKRASRAFLSRVKRDDVDRMPNDYHLRAIAVALGKPYEVIRRAAIAQWLPAEEVGSDNNAVERALLEQASRLEREAQELRRLASGQPGPGEAAAGRESA